jgi:hypothetical protein
MGLEGTKEVFGAGFAEDKRGFQKSDDDVSRLQPTTTWVLPWNEAD